MGSYKLRSRAVLRSGNDDFGVNEFLVELGVGTLLVGCSDEGVTLVLEPFSNAQLVLSCSEKLRDLRMERRPKGPGVSVALEGIKRVRGLPDSGRETKVKQGSDASSSLFPALSHSARNIPPQFWADGAEYSKRCGTRQELVWTREGILIEQPFAWNCYSRFSEPRVQDESNCVGPKRKRD